MEKARQALRTQASKHLIPFTLYTKPDYEVNWHHQVMGDKLTDFAFGRIRRLILTVPPRRGKSELASRRLPPFILGNFPDVSIISASYGQDLATDMSRDCKQIIMGPEYREVFPHVVLNPRHSITDDRQPRKNTADQWELMDYRGKYLARGVGGGVTGKGGDYLILDDPVKDEEEARSSTYRDKVWRWYTKVFRTRRAPGAGILVIMTRWHEDDLVGRLLDAAKRSVKQDQWEIVNLREIRRDEDNPLDPRRPGEVLWPSQFSLEEAIADRELDPYSFASLYQQDPSPEEGFIIKREWLTKRWKALPTIDGEWLISWDLKAGSTDSRSAFAVGQVWYRPYDHPGTFYLVYQVRERLEFHGEIEALRNLMGLYTNVGPILVEDAGDGKAFIDTLKTKVKGLIPIKTGGKSKEARLRACSHLFQAGNIILPDESMAPWLPEYIEELATFPSSTFKDQVDSTSQALNYWIAKDAEEGSSYSIWEDL